jgi:hypothetical protein
MTNSTTQNLIKPIIIIPPTGSSGSNTLKSPFFITFIAMISFVTLVAIILVILYCLKDRIYQAALDAQYPAREREWDEWDVRDEGGEEGGR